MVVLSTAVPAAVATLLLAVLNRFTARPVTIFRIIAALILLLSLVAPLTLPVPLGVRLTLVSMHIITAVIIVYVLTGRARSDSSDES
jgi:hypothetical protein